jgi:Na+-driven multidrug efflux pump
MNQTFMKEKPVIPLVISMSLPMAASMLVNSLYNIVDSYFVAKISDKAMTAISAARPEIGLCVACTIAGNVMTASVTYGT